MVVISPPVGHSLRLVGGYYTQYQKLFANEPLDHYRQSNYVEALAVSEGFGLQGFYVDHLLRAAALGQLGRCEEARAELETALEVRPDFAWRYRELLHRAFMLDALVEMLLDGLRKAGLEV